MIKQKPQDNPYPDGIVKLYHEENQAKPGNMPKEGLRYRLTLRYRRKTVGMTRYYTALQQQQRIDEMIRCPLEPSVSVRDIAEVYPGGKRYIVRQVQYPENTTVPMMDLALERLEGSNEDDEEDCNE